MTHESCILNVGDIAVIKPYEDLVAEFGTNDRGDVKVAESWELPVEYKKFCGKAVRILDVEYHGTVGDLQDFYSYDVREAQTDRLIGVCMTSYDLTYSIPPSPDDCHENNMKSLFQE